MPLLTTLVGFAALQGAWKTYPVGSGFQVDLPAPPEALPAAKGSHKDADTQYWMSVHEGSSAIVVATYPVKGDESGPTDRVLERSIRSAVGSMEAPLAAQRDVLFQGWPGVEYRLASPAKGMYGIGRSFVVDGAVVMLTVGSLSDAALDVPAAKLFASLKLPKGVGDGSLKVAGPEFRPYPLGESGLSVSFPKPPSKVASPKGSQILYRFESRYMNRVFRAAYIDYPEKEMIEDPAAVEAEINEGTAEAAGGKNMVTSRVKRGGREFLRTTFQLRDGTEFAQCETALIGNRLVTLSVKVPAPLAKAPEVDAFFASLKFE